MSKPILELINIDKIYDDGFIAIKDFNLTINKGEFITLLGPSGCGKTSMLKIIGGFEYPTKGKILYNGIDIKDMDVTQRPTSTVFQDYALFPNMTVKENIEYGIKLMRTPLENINKDISIEADKLVANCKKVAAKKIIDIEKEKRSIKKNINKLVNKYKKNSYLESIMEMRRPEFLATLDILYDKLEKEYGENFITKLSGKDRVMNFFNGVLTFFRIPYHFKVSMSKMNDIEKEIYLLKKWFYFKRPLDNKFISLNEKYNDLDYDISYWQNYPEIKREAFEKKNLTRKLTKEEITKRANAVIELVGLKGKENSLPSDLSGGMQQRTAFARSIVIEPQILLLDEPMGALDAKVRKQLQNEIKRLHKELAITFILVTHDQEEALMLSDKIVVMSDGKIEQIGSPNEIYDTPKNLWVANFIGRTNIFKAISLDNNKVQLINELAQVSDANITLDLTNTNYKFAKDSILNVIVRPEDFEIVKNHDGIFNNIVIIDVTYKGLMFDIKCKWHDHIITVESTKQFNVNTIVGLSFNIDDVHVIEEVEDNENK